MLHIKIKLSLMCHTLALCMGTQNYRLNFLAHPKSEAIFFTRQKLFCISFPNLKNSLKEEAQTFPYMYLFCPYISWDFHVCPKNITWKLSLVQ